jgi:hypothetical protein
VSEPQQSQGVDDQGDWESLAIPDELVPAAIEAFRTPEKGARWVELLNRVAAERVWTRVDGQDRWDLAWKHEWYLRSIAELELDIEEYQQWLEAGLEGDQLPRHVLAFKKAGLGPDHVRRWRAAGGNPWYLTKFLEFFDFDSAVAILGTWMAPHNPEASDRNQELTYLLDTYGWTVDRLREVMATGVSGHDIYLWRYSKMPTEQWAPWATSNVDPGSAERLWRAGIPAEAALQWVKTGLDSESILTAVSVGISPDQAIELAKGGTDVSRLERVDGVVQERAPDPDPWDEDPADQLPEVITPGKFSLDLWHMNSWDDNYTANRVWFTWAGGREVEWVEDISPETPSLSVMSSAPTWGIASWANGIDVKTTYESSDFDLDGEEVLAGAAPTSDKPDSDEGMRDPKNWVRLAEEIVGLVYSHID